MEGTFVESNAIIEQITTLFCQLEKYKGQTSTELQYEENIRAKIESLTALFERLDHYIMKEQPSKRQTQRLRLDQLKYDATHFKASLDNFQKLRYRREKAAADREELLNRRFTANDSSAIEIDQSLQHNTSLQNANRGVDDMLNQGYQILANLRGQHDILRSTNQRIKNFMNTLGLSNSVINFIERRAYEDKFVLYIGMCVTCIIMFFIYLYFT